jgi:hypothetical protein
MGGCLKGHITDARNKSLEEMSRRWRKMLASSEGYRSLEGAVVPYLDGWQG